MENMPTPQRNPVAVPPLPPQKPAVPVAPKNEESFIRKNMTLDQRIRRIEVDTAAIIRGLNGISGSAVCNEDGTITFTITIPGLPG